MAKNIITSKTDLPSKFQRYMGTTHGEKVRCLKCNHLFTLFKKGFAARPNMDIRGQIILSGCIFSVPKLLADRNSVQITFYYLGDSVLPLVDNRLLNVSP